MDAGQPALGDLDPELALALELDLLSDQELLDVAGLGWPGAPTSGSAPTAVPPLQLQPPLLPTWPLGASQQPFLPVVIPSAAGLGSSWSGGAAAAGTAAAAAPQAPAAGGVARPAPPKRSGRGSASSGISRYDKPGARKRKQEQQRNYRLRCKERAAEQHTQLAALGSAVQAARQQQQQLLEEQAALQKLQEYKDSLVEELPLSDSHAITPQAEGSSEASGIQTALPSPGHRAALTDSAGGGASGTATPTAAEAGDVGSSGDGIDSGEGSGCGSEGGSCGDRPLGSKDGDWEPVFPANWCKVGLASGSLPPPAADLMDAAVALVDRQTLHYDGNSSGGGFLAGMAAALLAGPDALGRRLVRGVKPYQLSERERGFRNLIKAAMEQWQANPAGRRRVEYRLQVLWTVRRKCFDWLVRVRPEVVAEARASHVLPAPLPSTAAAVTGSAAQGEGGMEGGVHHIMPPIVAQMRITDEQRERILAHWHSYQQRVAVARQVSREAIQRLQRQEAAWQQSGIPGPSGNLSSSAGHFLSSLQAASELATLPPEERAAWFELQHGLLKELTPVQNSLLLLGCAPYLPDCTQLCRLLEWQQQRQQLSRGDSGHFLATAVRA
ncbi:hypothetical protein C2E21_4569 [Chlorella sorokiniana]|uniref:Uncharacterized protein n=1 Tax=Chlorella sorokiniana TaxID=3076 RepID=A0A2P6TRQ1_CHLSO|nr:hypothetical protein C2E21_4569 [Chlorella sorokiniana]|eukprot:PRW56728.1 hypothetical protein C2E21_4569 [Chlorella sorokiniana]